MRFPASTAPSAFGGLGKDGVDGGSNGVRVGQGAFHSAISGVLRVKEGAGGTVLFLKAVTDVGGQTVAGGQGVLQPGEMIG
ncbi:hypothetical protein [Streptomyces canus]|uniref:hypothetical protein n=1 Tax=Streptomyces canus TaxID=58343 RepID=UPI0037114E86